MKLYIKTALRASLLFIFLILLQPISAKDYKHQLKSKSDYNMFAGAPITSKYGGISAIKIVYDIKSQKLFYVNANSCKYHHVFCRRHLGFYGTLGYFNRVNYSENKKRRYVLANINYIPDSDIYNLEFSPIEITDKERVKLIYNKVSESSYFGDKLHLLLNSNNVKSLIDRGGVDVPVITPDRIYKNLVYQPVSHGKTVGKLIYISNLKEQIDSIKPHHIVVLNETPMFLPRVAGVIVNQFQTPLSHLSILGSNRKIPICAYKHALTDSVIEANNNRYINFTVTENGFNIKESKSTNVSVTKQKPITVRYDLSVKEIKPVSELNRRSYKYAGNKASNFAILKRISNRIGFRTPESAFVIPFYHYNQHITNSGIKPYIDKLLKECDTIPAKKLRKQLKKIRKLIRKSDIDTFLLHAVEKTIVKSGRYRRMRFRSSTNAEDADGFSGAGLYSSKTGIVGDKKKSIAKAIKSVWASLWSYQAFAEREYFNIDHRTVYMGILVHRSFPKEHVNGVAITKNIYRSGSFGFVVNAQIGNNNVVKPDSGVVCDQFVCYPDNGDNIYSTRRAIDIITVSNLNNSQLTMSTGEIQYLANVLNLIKWYYGRNIYPNRDFMNLGLDIEFKLDGKSRNLYIKQIRLYND